MQHHESKLFTFHIAQEELITKNLHLRIQMLVTSFMDGKSQKCVDAVTYRKVGIVKHFCCAPHCLAVGPGSVRRDPHAYLERCIHDLDHVLCKAVGVPSGIELSQPSLPVLLIFTNVVWSLSRKSSLSICIFSSRDI